MLQYTLYVYVKSNENFSGYDALDTGILNVSFFGD